MDVGSPEAAEVLEEGVEIRSDTRRASLIDVDADVTAAVEAGFDRERAAISTFFGVDLVSREGTGFLRYRPGDFYRPHRDRASLPSVPGRKAPADPVPTFTMTVEGDRIAYVQFSGPREGEYLAADEVRFTPANSDRK